MYLVVSIMKVEAHLDLAAAVRSALAYVWDLASWCLAHRVVKLFVGPMHRHLPSCKLQ